MSKQNGKGSGRRPCQVPKEVVDNNWDRIFGSKKKPATDEKKS